MIKLEEHKTQTESKKIEALPLPARLYIPLSQHLGTITSPLVSIGEEVLLGQKIAAAKAHVSSLIHASVSGKVSAIADWPHPVLGQCKAIIIENNAKNEPLHKNQQPLPKEKISKLSADELRNAIYEAGIVGMGGASFPTHIKLKPPKPVTTLIINGAECEPYLTADYRLMVEKTKEILQGIELAARALSVRDVYIAIEDNKPEAIEKFRIYNTKFKIRVLKSQYPQGGEKQLIKNILRNEVPSGKLPFEVGVVVHNVATCFAIYEAVYRNKPLYERVVTVTGSCLANPKNVLVRIGTPIRQLIEFCGPLKKEPAKIIVGGPMMGIAQHTLEAPVIKSTTGIVLLNAKEAQIAKEEFCIRCGSCVRACPAYLMPTLISLASKKELWQQSRLYGALDCIECGLCSYVCPSKIMLVQSIRRAKWELLSSAS
jgi:electron transport complex protein RnfC